MRTHIFVAVSLLIVVLVAAPSQGAAVRTGFNSSNLGANDDSSTGFTPFGFTIDFFGVTYTGGYLNNNGNITFDEPMGTYTPFSLLSTGTAIIAPFFGDVDTGAGELMKFGSGTVDGHSAFGVTWDGVGVGYYYLHTDKLNKFQVLLIDRSDTGLENFDIEFNYDQIQWETGDASGGSGGLGGSSARAGYSNGIDTAYELAGSAVNGAFLDSNLSTGLIYNSNVGFDGRYVFQAREGDVDPGVVPEPSAIGI